MPIMASEHAVDARIARNECVNAVEFRRLHQSSERREEKCAPDSAVKRVNSNSVCRINANCLMCSGPRGLEELLDIFGHCIQDEVNTASPWRRSDTSTSRLPGGSLQSRGARRCFLYKKRRRVKRQLCNVSQDKEDHGYCVLLHLPSWTRMISGESKDNTNTILPAIGGGACPKVKSHTNIDSASRRDHTFTCIIYKGD